MLAIQAFTRRHPVLTYFALTFVLSWSGILAAVWSTGFPGSLEQTEFVLALLANEAGPLVAGILLTALVHGKAGLRALLARLLRWQVHWHWYAAAMLAAPLLVLPILLAFSIFSPLYLPSIVTATDKVSLLLLGIGVGLFGGFFEEPGWTGFAVPELRRRHRILTTGVAVGLAWAVWHVPLTLWASGDARGTFSPALFLPPLLFYFGVLPPFRVLMVWVYDRTESLLLAILMHVGLIASTLFILAPTANGAALAVYYVVLTAFAWSAVAVVATASRGQFTRQPLHREVHTTSS